MIDVNRQRLKYIVADYLSTVVAVLLFNISRFYVVDEISSVYGTIRSFLSSRGVINGLIVFPMIMMAIYAVCGAYSETIQRSRLKELTSSFSEGLIGTLLYFFLALINDYIPSTATSYEMLVILFLILSVCVYIPRAILTQYAARKIRSGQWGFNTLIVGTGAVARRMADELDGRYRSMALKVVGYVDVDNNAGEYDIDYPVYNLNEIDDVISSHNIQKLILAHNDADDRQASVSLISRLLPLDLSIFITPDFYQLMTLRPRLMNVRALPLIDISRADMSQLTLNVKRISDIVCSAAALIILSPLLAVIALMIKRDSEGPVFYRQERIGYHKRPFKIVKFRTMVVDAESDTPMLSVEDDPRITRVGRFLRKYRLDELPNFWNVLKGEMSLVGPRPEREYFIQQIIKEAPYYTMVHQVRPGITSWGMVQYGYANTVDGMIERLKFDILYLENISFLIDMKILIHTVKTVLTGRGM